MLALEELRPDLVWRYLLDPALPPPGAIEELVSTGKLVYRGTSPLPPGTRIFHSLSPLDVAVGLETLWPATVWERRLLRSGTVYDLIPALDPQGELADPVHLRRYRTRLELLRGADQLQVISAKVASDVERVLGGSPGRVVQIGAAPHERFTPEDPLLRTGIPDSGLTTLGIDRPFVLYPTGSHPRKNNEGLLQGWARLPEGVRGRVQLVLAGDLPATTVHHLRHLSRLWGFENGLVVTGEVTDDALVELYRRAVLVCFPSLAEGYGLPVAEALACGTPVVGSDIAPLDELLPERARFDPTDPARIGIALAEAIADGDHRRHLLAGSRQPDRWRAVAERTAAAFETLLDVADRDPPSAPRRRSSAPGGASRDQPRRAGQRRLALVSTFPPAPSGVAIYSYHLAEALRSGGKVLVDTYLDGPTPGQAAPPGGRSYRVEALEDVERLRGRYDEVVYALGNSHHHLGALALLRRRPGAVLAHDVRLTNLYRHEAGEVGRRPGGLALAIRAMYGDKGLPEGLGRSGDLSAADLDRYGLLLAREVIADSRTFLVSSAGAAALARSEARPWDAPKIRLLAFAFARSEALSQGFDDETVPGGLDGGAPALDRSGPLLAHFGIVDPSKRPFALVEAFAVLRDRVPAVRLAFVGPVSEELAGALRARATSLGIADGLVLTGAVTTRDYARLLEATTIAIQLRSSSNGEASAAVGECLASGIPTVVSDLGWGRELPADAVVRVGRAISPDSLANVLGGLLADELQRKALGAGGRREAASRSFRATADSLLELLFGSSPS